jgi:predicted  nucleic acid-binding Zn-ribbon protein
MTQHTCEQCGRSYEDDQQQESRLCPQCRTAPQPGDQDEDNLDLTPEAVGEHETDLLPAVEQEINESERRKATGQTIREKVEQETQQEQMPEPELRGLAPMRPLGLHPATFIVLVIVAMALAVAVAYYLVMT